MECPSQAGKLVRGIGRRELGLSRNSAAKTLATGTVEEFGSEDIGSLHAEANSAAQELAACTKM
jgi:hypothetical protein